MSYKVEKLSSNKAFGGEIAKYKFKAQSLGYLDAQFNLFVPESATPKNPAPVLYYLAGLECNEDTGLWKGGFLRDAASEGIALVFPDTSPRGAGIEGEDADWDFGTGAGFYINATMPKFSVNYNMDDYIVGELPKVIESLRLPVDLERTSIFGHSMGGHGAITLLLRYSKYRSASAFAPICNPSHPDCKWGQKAFSGYLKEGSEEGKKYDATELIKTVSRHRDVHILADYGDADRFYKQNQLLPENFIAAARAAGFGEDSVNVRLQPGYDHSYYTISTFGPEHIKFHAKFLKA